MKYIGGVVGFALAMAIGGLLDDAKVTASAWTMIGGWSLGVFLPMVGFAAGKIIGKDL